ncbi:hypothetical protein HMF3257_00800 [Spirosoma telluris]|uniref:Uncharacterized protein n=1 Tax=Spirosoma telluris TaxID=2183553 RepID=A0A327NGD6_9BACT|nr:hypothetical protein HMF3257_00800 [Spirosoma telluris]
MVANINATIQFRKFFQITIKLVGIVGLEEHHKIAIDWPIASRSIQQYKMRNVWFGLLYLFRALPVETVVLSQSHNSKT